MYLQYIHLDKMSTSIVTVDFQNQNKDICFSVEAKRGQFITVSYDRLMHFVDDNHLIIFYPQLHILRIYIDPLVDYNNEYLVVPKTGHEAIGENHRITEGDLIIDVCVVLD